MLIALLLTLALCLVLLVLACARAGHRSDEDTDLYYDHLKGLGL